MIGEPEKLPTIPPHWVRIVARTVNTLHSFDFTRLQAIRILTYCLQCVATEEERWAGDPPKETPQP